MASVLSVAEEDIGRTTGAPQVWDLIGALE